MIFFRLTRLLVLPAILTSLVPSAKDQCLGCGEERLCLLPGNHSIKIAGTCQFMTFLFNLYHHFCILRGLRFTKLCYNGGLNVEHIGVRNALKLCFPMVQKMVGISLGFSMVQTIGKQIFFGQPRLFSIKTQFFFVHKMVQAIQKLGLPMIRTIGKWNKMVAILM